MAAKVLIPLDGSKTGEVALPYIQELMVSLSPRVKIEVTLFQVVSLRTHYVAVGEGITSVLYTGREIEQVSQQAREYLDDYFYKITDERLSEFIV